MSNPSPEQGDSNSQMLDQILGTPTGASGVSLDQSNLSPSVAPTPDSAPTLEQILSQSANQTTPSGKPLDGIAMKPSRPPRPPMKAGDFFKIIGALFGVSLIFFGSFLAYIVFNPDQAQFFRNLGINPGSIQDLLSRLVNGVFGILTFTFSLIWIIVLFKAFITKKEYRKKKVIAVILSIVFGISLFATIGFWSYLIKRIGISDYANPNGWVILYDNDKLISNTLSDSSEITDTSALVGPVTIKFDLKSDVKHAEKTIRIESFEIDFEGDGVFDTNQGDIEGGINPESAENIIYTYSKKGIYTPRGKYIGIDTLTGEQKAISIAFAPINIVGIIKMNRSEAKKTVVFDASDMKALGKPTWYESEDLNTVASSEPLYTTRVGGNEKFVCFAIERPKQIQASCDKIFVITSTSKDSVSGNITFERDKIDPLLYNFSISGLKMKDGAQIEQYEWSLDNGMIFSREESPSHLFTEFGKDMHVRVQITDNAGRRGVIESEWFTVERPVILMKTNGDQSLLKMTDGNGRDIITGTYNRTLQSYYLQNLPVPSKVSFDASDVRVVTPPGFVLDSVNWKIGNVEKTGKKMEFEFVEESRTTVEITYHFAGKSGEQATATERVMVEGKKSDIVAIMKMTQDSEYAPVNARFDGSTSTVKNGTITKFIYDFGTGRPPAEGDAVQTYVYDTPGEYNVRLTIVKDDGTKSETERRVVVKATPRTVTIESSISSGSVGKPIDFNANVSGQIESYTWDFGDNTSTSLESSPSHTYAAEWKYRVVLSVRYTDGTMKSAERFMEIQP